MQYLSCVLFLENTILTRKCKVACFHWVEILQFPPFVHSFRDYGSTHLTPLLEDEVEAAAAEFQVAGTRSISGLRSDSCSLEGTGSKLGRLTELTLKGMPGIPLLTGIMQLFDCSVDLAALVGVRWSCWGPTFADSTGPWHCMRQMCISQDAGLKVFFCTFGCFCPLEDWDICFFTILRCHSFRIRNSWTWDVWHHSCSILS